MECKSKSEKKKIIVKTKMCCLSAVKKKGEKKYVLVKKNFNVVNKKTEKNTIFLVFFLLKHLFYA